MNAQTHPWPTAHSVEDFRRNLAAVHRRIADACSRAGRDPSDVRLLPVSKTVPEERIRLAYAAGCRDLGENELQPFDFITLFDYAESDSAAFEDLVGELRATEEWKFVDREVDIRLIAHTDH